MIGMTKDSLSPIDRHPADLERIHEIEKQTRCGRLQDTGNAGITRHAVIGYVQVQIDGIMPDIDIGLFGFQRTAISRPLSKTGQGH